MSEPLMTYKEAAALLGIKPDTLYRWVAQGKVPHKRLGKFVRFTPSHIEQILADAEVPATPFSQRRPRRHPHRR